MTSSACSTAYIALGSNLGDRSATLRSAIDQLAQTPGLKVRAVSDFVETEPVGPSGQGRYLNAAAELQTLLTPRKLLDRMLAIEQAHGRDRQSQSEKWGPRTLDLDLILFDRLVMDEPGLTLPHPRMHEREFVLKPLAQIAGGISHPVMGLTIESLLLRLAESRKCHANQAKNRDIDVS